MIQHSRPKYGTMEKFLKAALVTLLFLLICCIVILSLVPPVSKDALTHHLAVPKLYLNHGGIYEMPDLVVSYYPMNLELLYTIPLYFGNDILPKFIHFAFAMLTSGLIFFYLKKRIDTLFAFFGSLFFLSIPIIVKLSITVYVDLGLIFFSTGSLIYLFKWIDSQFKIKYLLISAVCCGLALGTKYNGLITFFLITLFVPFMFSRKTTAPVHSGGQPESNGIEFNELNAAPSNQLKSVGYAVLFFVVSLVVFSPWMIRNIIWTGNPVYPLYDTYFNSPNIKPIPGIMAGKESELSSSQKSLSHFSLRSHMYNESWWQIALIPVRIFFQGKDDNPQYFDGKLNPLLLFLPLFAFVGLKRDLSIIRTEKKIMLAFAILFILFVFFKEDMRIRWIAPAIPPLVLLSAFGLHNTYAIFLHRFSPGMGKISSVAVFSILCLMLWSNVVYIGEQFNQVDPISYLTGRITRDEYIERFRHEYPTIQFANHNLSKDAKMLCLFLGNRLYYSDREMVFNEALFKNTVKRARSSKAITIELERAGITHLLIRYDLFNSWFIDNFDDREKKMINKFFDEHAFGLFSKNNYGLFELKTKIHNHS